MQYANEIDNDPLKSFQVRQSNSITSLLVGPLVGVSVGLFDDPHGAPWPIRPFLLFKRHKR